MYDLDTLKFLNRRVVLEQQPKKQEEIPTPLGKLSRLLKMPRPPSLGNVINLYNSAEYYADFLNLVREYLPEREKDILQGTGPGEQIAKFASYFEDRYFPLYPSLKDDEGEYQYSDLTSGVPLMVMGRGWEKYENSDDRLGSQLMTFLFASPFDDQEGARVSLADHFPDAYREQARRLPPGGARQCAAKKILKGKKWEGLKIWLGIIYQDTGNYFLDTDDEMLSNSVNCDWDMKTVLAAAEDWKKAEAAWDKAIEFAVWLEDEKLGPERFKETIDFLLEHLEPEAFAGG